MPEGAQSPYTIYLMEHSLRIVAGKHAGRKNRFIDSQSELHARVPLYEMLTRSQPFIILYTSECLIRRFGDGYDGTQAD